MIEWPSIIDESMLQNIQDFKNSINDFYIKSKVEINHTYNSLLIIYDMVIDNVNDAFLELKSLYNQLEDKKKSKQRLWEIPVCYDDKFGIDLEQFSRAKKLSKSEIIQLHSSQIYTIFFTGFLPGFLYLGGLDNSLHLDRKSTPNLNIKKGAVGIGGKQTGIYPQNSPGGWHIIGNSPINFFDVKSDNPCFAKAGEKIKFVPISISKYNEIQNQMSSNSYQLKSSIIDD